MAENFIDSFTNNFEPITKENWTEKILKDLKIDTLDSLIFNYNNAINVEPFYTIDDNEKYQIHIPAKENIDWKIVEKIKVINFNESNKKALNALQNGANCIVFDVENCNLNRDNILVLLTNILIDIAPVFFINFNKDDKTLIQYMLPNHPIDIIHLKENNNILVQLKNAFVALENAIKNNINYIVFDLEITTNYFFEIAKIRAFRWLIFNLKKSCNSTIKVEILSSTTIQNRSEVDMNTNIISNTTQAMSAIIGGCDLLLVNEHHLPTTSNFGKRIARNIQNLLVHESYFDKQIDIAKGAYYIEYLTHQIAKIIWDNK